MREITPSTIELTHDSGSLTFNNPEIRKRESRTEIRVMVDSELWNRIRKFDIFGTSTRKKKAGSIPEDFPIRITISTGQDISDYSASIPSSLFVIEDAMFQIDPEEINAAGLEGDIWEGVRFTEPESWSLALFGLEEAGFVTINGLANSETMYNEEEGIGVEFRHIDNHNMVRVQAVCPLNTGEDPNPAVYELLNNINSRFYFGSVIIDAGDILVRHTFPSGMGAPGSQLISEKVFDLIGVISVLKEPLIKVSSGALSVKGAIEEIFSE